jgi:hypothetical protein
MNLWKAGFIEDAIDLHLDAKPTYASYISRLVKSHGVRTSYFDLKKSGRGGG